MAAIHMRLVVALVLLVSFWMPTTEASPAIDKASLVRIPHTARGREMARPFILPIAGSVGSTPLSISVDSGVVVDIRENTTTAPDLIEYLTLALSALVFSGVLYLIIIIFRRDVIRGATAVVKGGAAFATEPSVRRTAGWSQTSSRAVLHVLSGDEPNRRPFPLIKGSTRLGRDAALVDVVFENPHVSRLHARIEEEAGHFAIYDEGSTSGTYVNDVDVPVTGCVLQHNDCIDLGSVQLRFELPGASPLISEGPSAHHHDSDDTEPFRL